MEPAGCPRCALARSASRAQEKGLETLGGGTEMQLAPSAFSRTARKAAVALAAFAGIGGEAFEPWRAPRSSDNARLKLGVPQSSTDARGSVSNSAVAKHADGEQHSASASTSEARSARGRSRTREGWPGNRGRKDRPGGRRVCARRRRKRRAFSPGSAGESVEQHAEEVGQLGPGLGSLPTWSPRQAGFVASASRGSIPRSQIRAEQMAWRRRRARRGRFQRPVSSERSREPNQRLASAKVARRASGALDRASCFGSALSRTRRSRSSTKEVQAT